MKASPLPLTLGKLESFNIVELEGDKRQPYSTGVCYLQSVFFKNQDPPESSWVYRFLWDAQKRKEPQLVSSRGNLLKPFKNIFQLQTFQSNSYTYAMESRILC